MKIAWVAPAWPVDPSDPIAADARALESTGVEFVVVAGSARASAADELPSGGANASRRAVRIDRKDLFPAHWQKSASVACASEFRAILQRERPDVVHIHGWRGLSRDLVFTASLERVPAVVSIHDDSSTCLIEVRVRPESGEPCTVVLAPQPCLGCAGRTPLATAWVPPEAQYLAFAERKSDLLRELVLARTVLVRNREDGDRVRRYLGEEVSRLAPFAVLSSDDRARALRDIYRDAIAAGAPAVVGASANDWFTQRMKAFAETEWDKRAALASAVAGRESHETRGEPK